MLQQIDEHVGRGDSFAFETTSSGRGHARRIPRWQTMGYRVELLFLRLPTPEMAAVSPEKIDLYNGFGRPRQTGNAAEHLLDTAAPRSEAGRSLIRLARKFQRNPHVPLTAPLTQRRTTGAIIGPCASSTPKGRCARTSTMRSGRWIA